MPFLRCIYVVVALCLVLLPARSGIAQDFFSDIFGAITGQRPLPPPMRHPGYPPPYYDDGYAPPYEPRQPRTASQSYCVRTCDGRFFPVQSGEGQSKASACANLCPASDTKVYVGSSIDSAVNESGRTYASQANAFRFRNELVNGCTCNGKDHLGLAKVSLDNDTTIRRGDLVSTPDGLMIAGGYSKRGVVNLSPVKRGK